LIDRADGRPLGDAQGAEIIAAGSPVAARFSPGSYTTLTQSEALVRPPFDVLESGKVLSFADPDPNRADNQPDDRKVRQIVIIDRAIRDSGSGLRLDLSAIATLTGASRLPPTLGDASPLVVVHREKWATTAGDSFESATGAYQSAKYLRVTALAAADAAAPVELVGV
jgi:hypothetical protein